MAADCTRPHHTYSTVIIDSDTAAGAPNDGRDIFEWWKKHVTSWERANLGVLVLAHIPKRDTELPTGPIGSQSKRGLLTGASYVMETGTIWNQDTGGVVYMRLDKDREGELPGTEGDTVVDVVAGWMEVGGSRFLNITLEVPDADRGIQKLVDQLDTVLAEYPEGVYSQKGVKELVKGKGQDISKALKILMDTGHVITEKVDGKRGLVYKSAVFQD